MFLAQVSAVCGAVNICKCANSENKKYIYGFFECVSENRTHAHAADTLTLCN